MRTNCSGRNRRGGWTASIKNFRIQGALLGALALAAVPAFGNPITAGPTWYEFDFGLAGTAAIGCGTALTCTQTQNPAADQGNTTPWTFSLGPSGGSLFVLDLGDVGDRFEVFDNLASLGLTSNVANPTPNSNPCGSAGVLDIACSAGNAAYSNRLYSLASGSHSITINVVQNAGTTTFGQAVFQVTQSPSAAPEPSYIILMSAGLVGLAYSRRRRVVSVTNGIALR